jgi:proteasome lid subunit RPN8/RPN11
MIRIEQRPWEEMLEQARTAYPEECCGAMLGRAEGAVKTVAATLPLENVFAGSRRTRYEVRPGDLLSAQREARSRGLALIGIYHSHPDREAYFSETDLGNSCPWYSFVVLSIRDGEFSGAGAWLPEAGQRRAAAEELDHPPRARADAGQVR